MNRYGTILVAGLGSAGQRHVRNLRSLTQSRFIFYRTGKATLATEELEDGAPSYSDLEGALSERPDLAIIANPTAFHMPVALAAAKAGCHLFIEKPLSHSREGSAELKSITESKGLITMIGCQFRFHPLLLALKEGLDRGRIGAVLGARADWGEYLPDWHPWEDHRKSYAARPELGGGALLTLIHPLDYMYWFFGDVKSVVARARKVDRLETSVPDDWADVLLEFKSGVLAQVHVDLLQRPSVHSLTVWGELGKACWDYHTGRLEWTDSESGVEVERLPEDFDRNDLFLAEMRHFLECAAQKRPSRVPLEDGIAVLEIALRAREAAMEAAAND